MTAGGPVIILGGGVSGLSAAWKLAARGIPVTVLEASSRVGGLASTVRQNGYALDFGPHSFFAEDDSVLHTVLGLFSNPLMPMQRNVKFYYRGKYLDYPFSAISILKVLSWDLVASVSPDNMQMRSPLFAPVAVAHFCRSSCS